MAREPTRTHLCGHVVHAHQRTAEHRRVRPGGLTGKVAPHETAGLLSLTKVKPLLNPLPKLLPLPVLLVSALLVSACGSANGVCESRRTGYNGSYSYSCVNDPDASEDTCTSGSTPTAVQVWWSGKTCEELGYGIMSPSSWEGENEIYSANEDGTQPGAAGTWSGSTPTGDAGTPDPYAVFDGTWASASGNLKVTRVGTNLTFSYVASSTDPSSWSNAMSKGYIFIGKEWIRNIQPNGSAWKCEVLWKEWSSSTGVTSVYWSPGSTISFNAAKTEMTVTSTDNDGITGSAIMYKQP
jgi:hypothetical protein